MIVLPSCSPAVRLDYSFSCLLQFGFFLLDRVKYDNWDFFVFFTISQANSINSHWRPAGFCSDRGRLSNHSVAPLCHEVTEEWSTLLLVITHADSRKQIQKNRETKNGKFTRSITCLSYSSYWRSIDDSGRYSAFLERTWLWGKSSGYITGP